MAVGRARSRGSEWRSKLLLSGALLGLALLLVKWTRGGQRTPPNDAETSSSSQPANRIATRPRPLRRSDAPTRQRPGSVPEEVKRRCRGTLGSWCIDFHTQIEVPAVTAPRGSKRCSLNCNLVGVCSALSGLCTCPAGWTGFNCLHPMKRHCTHKYRDYGFEAERVEGTLSAGLGPSGTNTFQFTRSHCAGECDSDIAACFCPSNTTYGRIPASEEAQQGFPPIQHGRPMGQQCQPNKMPDGRNTTWGTVDPADLYGPEGWCTAAEPKIQCDCYLDGWGGKNCEEPYEQFCPNQCNGRGECNHGFCKCDEGWHGIDCAHRSSSANAETPGREVEQAWIADHVHTPAAHDFAANATRKRPLIYVYEMHSDYSTLMLQYRGDKAFCTTRYYTPGNNTALSTWAFNVEAGFFEALLQSEHRTLDPEEADFFYVPVFTSCYIEPVRGVADTPRDLWYGIHDLRVHGITTMLMEAYHWVQSHFPYFDRRGGRDHIWLVTHDESSCYVPAAIRPGIILSHWGRTDANHTTTTGYWEDEYSNDFKHPHWAPDGFLWMFKGHKCYDAEKDLVIPLMKNPNHFHASPLVGGATRNRTWLAFHRGLVQLEHPPYSRGIRQRLWNASKEHNWLERHKIVVGGYDEVQGDYSELLAASIFCLVVPGHGWSARMDDAMLHGCIPVVIMDDVETSLASLIDHAQISIRIAQADTEKLADILLAVSEERRREMQQNIAKVWQRFAYSSYRPYASRIRELQRSNAEELLKSGTASSQPLSLPATVPDLDPFADDAFSTIMGFLYSRLKQTR